MLKIVSNTTPIISLLKLSKLDLLQKLYGEINIPKAVYEEIEAGKQKVFYQNLAKISWINILEIENKQALNYFIDLDKGEAEAIILATEINADLTIIDEKLGRFYAKNTGLKITGTIGTLLKAKTKGFVKEIKPLIIELEKQNVWFSNTFINQVLSKAGEL